MGHRNEDGVYFDEPGCIECDWGERPCHCVEDPTIADDPAAPIGDRQIEHEGE